MLSYSSSASHTHVLDLRTATASLSLDYANSIRLVWLTVQNIARLQRAQNAAARVVTQKSSHLSSVDTLCELHCLSVQWSIKFKLTSLTFKAIHTGTPPYLSRFIPYCPYRVLRSSSSSNLLQVPTIYNLIFGSRSFCTAAPTIWSSLPDSLFMRYIPLFQNTFIKRLFIFLGGILQRLGFTYVTNGAL